MKTVKNLFIATLVIVAGYTIYSVQHEKPLSDLAMSNIEALASGEGSDCDNANGYRRILEGNERIYDCCYQEKVGKGREDCKRW